MMRITKVDMKGKFASIYNMNQNVYTKTERYTYLIFFLAKDAMTIKYPWVC